MPDTITDVKPGSSTGGVNGGSPSQDDLVKVKGDYERLKGAMASLQAEHSANKDKLERLEALEEQFGELSKAQEAEKNRLLKKEDNIDAEIDELRGRREARAWFEQQKRELEKTKKEASTEGKMEALRELAADFLEDKAEEHSTKENPFSVKDLVKQLKKYSIEYTDKNPYRLVTLAYRDWKKAQDDKAEDEKKKSADLSQEDVGRLARESTSSDLLKKNGDLSNNERVALREKLGIMHKPR